MKVGTDDNFISNRYAALVKSKACNYNMMFHTMNVVTRHIMTITEKVFLLRMPAFTPADRSVKIH